jgi:hypothetical protein
MKRSKLQRRKQRRQKLEWDKKKAEEIAEETIDTSVVNNEHAIRLNLYDG